MYLRQSTASQEITLGRFLDSTDGNTEETALSIANTDVKIWKEGATTLASKNSGGATHIANGLYYCVLDATDTDTVGKLEVHTHVSGALATKATFYVLEEAVYDAFFAASAAGYVSNAPVNVAQISGDSAAADNAESFFDGTGYAGTGNTIPTVTTLTNLPSITSNWLTAAGLATDAVQEIRDAVTGGAYALSTDANGRVRIVDGTGAGELDTTSGKVSIVSADITSIQSGLATASALATVDGIVDSIVAVTDKLDTALEDDGSSGWQFTTLALENAPSGGGGGGTDWTADERTAIRTIMGFNGSGVVGDPASGILDTIRDSVGTRQATFTAATGVTFPSNFGSLSINGSGHVTLADSSLTTAKLGTFALAKTTNITGFNDISTSQVNTEADAALADVGLTTTVTGRIDAAVTSRPTLAQILAGGDVDGYTLEQTLKLCLAALAGKLSGAATTTITIRAADDSKARITATVDADGNRSAVTLDAAG